MCNSFIIKNKGITKLREKCTIGIGIGCFNLGKIIWWGVSIPIGNKKEGWRGGRKTLKIQEWFVNYNKIKFIKTNEKFLFLPSWWMCFDYMSIECIYIYTGDSDGTLDVYELKEND